MNRFTLFYAIAAVLLAGFAACVGVGIYYVVGVGHSELVSNRNVYSDEMQTYFSIRLVTRDAFAAGNPIDIDVHTRIWEDTGIWAGKGPVRSVQLVFQGADKTHPGELPTLRSSYGASDESRDAIDQYFEALAEFQEESRSNVMFLVGDRNPVTGLATFSGHIDDLVYPSGGDFDVEITVSTEQGVIGHGIGDRRYALLDVVTVSPPEVLIAIRNGDVMTGLAYIAVGISLLSFLIGVMIILIGTHRREVVFL